MKHKNQYDVCIFGLGYVGLTLATAFSSVGLKVLGIEKRKDVVDLTNNGRSHFYEVGLEPVLKRSVEEGKFVATQDSNESKNASIFVITVGTPLDKEGTINLDMISNVAHDIARNMGEDSLIILRSTVKIGTSKHIVAPILEKSGVAFDLAMCPERTLEGNAMRELYRLPQIIGADCEIAAERAASLFKSLTRTTLKVSSLETAEMIKLVDNTYRDVQFAFANEVARACETMHINGYEVITSGKLGYERTNVPLPGPVGGPCLSKDPHILMQSVADKGISLEITHACRLVNERQPKEVAEFICREVNKRATGSTPPQVTLAGMAFKGHPATDDLRGSTSTLLLEHIVTMLPDSVITLFDFEIDPSVLHNDFPSCQAATSFDAAVSNRDCVIIANNHKRFKDMLPQEIHSQMNAGGFIYDCWNLFSDLKNSQKDDFYFAIGSGHSHS